MKNHLFLENSDERQDNESIASEIWNCGSSSYA